jgi:hypothetical protein
MNVGQLYEGTEITEKCHLEREQKYFTFCAEIAAKRVGGQVKISLFVLKSQPKVLEGK